MKFNFVKALITVILLFGSGWSAYWFVGGRIAKSAIEDRLRSESSLDIQYSDLSISGFPNRFDFTFADTTVSDSRSGIRWEAPFFQILSLSYDWTHLIAIWPPKQLISVAGEEFSIAASGMRSSIVIDIRPEFNLDRLALEADEIRISNADRLLASIEGIVFAAESRESEANLYRVGVSVPIAEFGNGEESGIRLASDLPFAVSNLVGDIQIGFGSPPRIGDLKTLESRLSEISIDRLKASFNGLEISIEGDLEFSASGYPVGELTIEAENPQILVDIAAAAGAITKEQADRVYSAATLLSLLAPNDGALRIPIQFEEGLAYYGGIAVGPALRLNRD